MTTKDTLLASDDVAAIAAGLTKAQRAALDSAHWQNWTPLIAKNLVYWGNGFDGKLRLKMRPAFSAVRAYLKENGNG